MRPSVLQTTEINRRFEKYSMDFISKEKLKRTVAQENDVKSLEQKQNMQKRGLATNAILLVGK